MATGPSPQDCENAVYVSRDPLAVLSAPKVEVDTKVEFDTEEPDIDLTPYTLDNLTLTRKVVECYGCSEYAFDGTFTAFATDEGDQPFCRECVTGIEKRSEDRRWPSYVNYGWKASTTSPLFMGSGSVYSFTNHINV